VNGWIPRKRSRTALSRAFTTPANAIRAGIRAGIFASRWRNTYRGWRLVTRHAEDRVRV
jgi:hypothetical protein